jgi:hypothetical protein
MTTAINETATCPNCGGTGKLPHFSHVANGDCFACGGTGTIIFKTFIGDNSDVILEVFKHNGKFWHAFLRCRTWKNYVSPSHGPMHEWGKDLWCKRIDDAAEARELWRNAANTGIKTALCD